MSGIPFFDTKFRGSPVSENYQRLSEGFNPTSDRSPAGPGGSGMPPGTRTTARSSRWAPSSTSSSCRRSWARAALPSHGAGVLWFGGVEGNGHLNPDALQNITGIASIARFWLLYHASHYSRAFFSFLGKVGISKTLQESTPRSLCPGGRGIRPPPRWGRALGPGPCPPSRPPPSSRTSPPAAWRASGTPPQPFPPPPRGPPFCPPPHRFSSLILVFSVMCPVLIFVCFRCVHPSLFPLIVPPPLPSSAQGVPGVGDRVDATRPLERSAPTH